VEVGSDIEIKWAAHLLQLNVPGIVAALTLKTSEMRNENLVIPLNIDQALGNYHLLLILIAHIAVHTFK
jgi:myosin-15